nr:[protein-PII] uridylyltransferase [uncultured Sphingomonas sp.]
MRQPPRYDLIEDRRAIIDRRAIAEQIAGLPDKDLQKAATQILRGALTAGYDEIAQRLSVQPGRGRVIAASYSFLNDQIVRLAHDLVVERLYPVGIPSAGERLAIVGLGGTGRGEMARYSDLDLMFLIGDHRAPWCEQVSEALLYLLWDLKFKVGHSVRTPDEVIAAAKADMTIRTSLIEARWIWGDEALADHTKARFKRDIIEGTAREFVAAKLAERDRRHERMGDSRYVVEPNVKDGKGGLRDLHTLYWIGKYAYGVDHPSQLVDRGLLTPTEFYRFERAERFFWSVRCHLHLAAGRAEERLGFDFQRQLAEAMRYADRPGKSAVERFMQFYFLNAKAVGDLTGVFLAQLDEQMGDKGRRFALPTLRRRPKRLHGFVQDRGRISVPNDHWFRDDPARLIQMFEIAAHERLEIHPSAMRAAAHEARLVERVRDDARANSYFLDTLTAKDRPDTALRWMNEAGVFGRFIPDFGRVVAQMQFDMYHHYTVDEHSIQAIGLLSRIERGELADDHPLSTALFKQIASRRVLYVAVLLHDIAKGRGGDHSELGAEVAKELCPRLGLDAAETETVAWLVRHHLLMSHTAFRRDLADPKTIEDFVKQVQSPERLRLLLMLTVVDIRAVGPGTWSEWKRLLLRSLFDAAEERLRLGHKQRGRDDRVRERQNALASELNWTGALFRAHAKRLRDSYWLAEPLEWQRDNALQVAKSEATIGEPTSVKVVPDPESGTTRVTIFTADRPGLFYRIVAALSGAGASIVDARVHTTRDGMALDNLLISDGRGKGYTDTRSRQRLAKAVEAALLLADIDEIPTPVPATGQKADIFEVAPRVLVNEKASSRTTVVEVNAHDRPGLLARLAAAIHAEGLKLHSAHIATYGERAVDVFYLSDDQDHKVSPDKADALRRRLLDAISD